MPTPFIHRRRRATLAPLVAVLVLAPPAGAAPVIHAHRGGSLADGVARFPEDAMPAFENAARVPGTWLELDAVVSADGVPFVIHDATLDRTTDCTGAVSERTAAEIEACRIDTLGTAGRLTAAPPDPVVRVPRLTEVLALAGRTGAAVNVEIKQIIGDPGYDLVGGTHARVVARALRASGIPNERLIVQSFDPNNLKAARDELPSARLSYLTTAVQGELGPSLAAQAGAEWVSPGGVPSAAYVARAHRLGVKVIPYTLNTPGEVVGAATAGVDAVITDDVPMARRALGLTEPAPRADVRLLSRSRRRVIADRGFRVRLTADGPATRSVLIRLGRHTLAGGLLSVPSAGARTFSLRIHRGRWRSLERRRRIRLTVRTGDGARRTVVLR